MENEKLTGKTAYRVGFFGKVILQVEVEYGFDCEFLGWTISTKYRDASATDLVRLLQEQQQ